MRPLLALSSFLRVAVLLPAPPPPGARPTKPILNGFEMYLEETGYQIAGRKVELVVEATAGNPGTAITKLRKFVESDRVDMVVGEVFAHMGPAPDAPRAREVDRWGNPIQSIYVRKVERQSGELQRHGHPHPPGRLAVLEVQARRVPRAARVQPRLSPLHGAPGGSRC